MLRYLQSAIALCFITFILFCSKSAGAASPCPNDMVMIPSGTFTIGSDYSSEERPASDVFVDRFCIDRTEVTNAQFSKFVQATRYQTVAERPLSKEQFPDLSEEARSPGSLVFQIANEGGLSSWRWTKGANWQHPFGVDSSTVGKDNYPVVHIAHEDAIAYAKWVGKELPTEAQWEYAARGGLDRATYTWGNQYSETKANTWQGLFPFFNTKVDRHLETAPVGSFPPNGYGLYDMAGNVWEWTSDRYQVGHQDKTHQDNPTAQYHSFDPNKPEEPILHVIKGGSYLCAPNYCVRYRPAARESQSRDTGTTHIGFCLIKPLT